MSDGLVNTKYTIISQRQSIGSSLLSLLIAGMILCTLSWSDSARATGGTEFDPVLAQAVFRTPEQAAETMILAITTEDEALLEKLLGADFRAVLPTETVRAEDTQKFLAAWKSHNTLLAEGEQKRLIAVGEEEWTLPVPIVAGESGWYFDVDEGLERMRIRRIGRNELAAMQAVLAYYDAQMEYAEVDRVGNGMLEYARHIISTPGTRDGLYWEDASGKAPSPLGPLMADREPAGGYYGYYYRILEAQGAHARDGAYSYLLNGHLRAGFALIAWPVDYGESGVMSFLVNHDGIVYEQDLGPDSEDTANTMQAFDPAPGWTLTKEVNASK